MPARRTVKDRLISLSQATPDSSYTTAALAKAMLEGLDGQPTSCTVDRHFRTRIFDYPGVILEEPVPAHTIYGSGAVRADLVGDLEAHLKHSSPHFTLSPPLRQEVKETLARLDRQGQDAHPFLVIQEVQDIEPVLLEDCALVSEVTTTDGERTPFLIGGRDNANFVLAVRTSQSTWPTVPSNEDTVKAILTVARASQNAHDEIPKHIDQTCLVTDDDRFVSALRPSIGLARGSAYSPLDADGFRTNAQAMTKAMAKLEADLQSEHIQLLVNALYWDDYKDDCFRRLHYLSLWQSLNESRKKLGHIEPGSNIRLIDDATTVAGNHTLAELTQYRHDVAHWWKGSMDGNYLADMYRTLNELIRRRYFQSSAGKT